MELLNLPNTVLVVILGALEFRQQLQFLTVSRIFHALMPFTKVKLADTALKTFDASSNPPEKRQKVSSEISPSTRIFTGCRSLVISGRCPGQYLDQCKQLASAFRSVERLYVPDAPFPLHLLDLFPELKCFVGLRLFNLNQKATLALSRLRCLKMDHFQLDFLRAVCPGVLESRLGQTRIPGLQHLRLNRYDNDGKLDYSALTHCFPNAKTVHVCDMSSRNKVEVPLCNLLQFPSIRSLKVECKKIRFAKLGLNGCFPSQLHSLSLKSEEIVTQFHYLEFVPVRLKRLCLADTACSVEDLTRLPDALQLSYLDISRTPSASDGLFEFLIERRYPIETLVADAAVAADQVSDSGIARYFGWTQCLARLSVRGHVSISDKIFCVRFPALHRLREIRLVGTGINGTGGVKHWACQRQLMVLRGGHLLPNVRITVNSSPDVSDITFSGGTWITLPETEQCSKAPYYNLNCEEECCVSWWVNS